MISFEQACEIAREQKPEADYCVEYADHYRFFRNAEDGGEDESGGYVIVMKQEGDYSHYVWLLQAAASEAAEPIRTIELRR
ncbi:MAG: hypothetical protein IJT18_05095 [Oscillospiraceae bacterium]|nr:hypothetical protein [Oscillospiraceae bacterium]